MACCFCVVYSMVFLASCGCGLVAFFPHEQFGRLVTFTLVSGGRTCLVHERFGWRHALDRCLVCACGTCHSGAARRCASGLRESRGGGVADALTPVENLISACLQRCIKLSVECLGRTIYDSFSHTFKCLHCSQPGKVRG